MLQTFRNAWRIEELRKKILFTLLIVLLYRLGNAVPVPFVDTKALADYFQASGLQNTILGLFNVMSGGAFSQATIFALSIQPYINASIIIQLLCIAIPSLERLQKEGGEEGKKKIASITRYSTVAIGLLQGFAYYMMMRNYSLINADFASNVWAAIVIILTFTSGSALIMWLGEQITEFGIGNGISIILFVSIVARFPNSIIRQINNVANGDLAWWVLVLMYLGALLLIVLIVIAGILAGAVWAVIPAIFKAKWNTNETLFTLMMNYVATQLVAYFIIVWESPKGSGKVGIINQSTEAGWLPQIGGYKYLLTILVVAVLTVLVYVYLNYSKHGYEISVVGESERTARYVGIKVGKVIVRTMLLSGALCGIAGVLLVSGTDHTITTTIAGGQGFTAVMVSWLAKFNPLGMIFTSFLLVFLDRGAGEISTVFGLNQSFADILSGIIIFFIIGCEFFITYRLSFRKPAKKEAAEHV